jgi:hypothetical protein
MAKLAAQIFNLSLSMKTGASRDDFPKLTERRFVIGFGPAQAQSRLQAGALPFGCGLAALRCIADF